MVKVWRVLTGFLILALESMPVEASTTFVVDFEDDKITTNVGISLSETPIVELASGSAPSSSKLTFANMVRIDAVNAWGGIDSGYRTALTSGNWVGLSNNRDTPMVITGFDKHYNSFSMFSSAAWYEGLSLEIKGHSAQGLAFSHLYQLSPYRKDLISFNLDDATRLEFRTFGGVETPLRFGQDRQQNFSWAAYEDMTFSNVLLAVPEPSTWLMMLVGFVLAGRGLKRRSGGLVAA